ncbi:MAG TPA: SDR family NAD(P)-dependent oxidoreductase [Mesoaciditoga lauensis]|nr:SDR family NAD(P)-dependent oxidoreductase [Mesoaciditoga lauensis]
MSEKVLVTGGAGFIGSNIVDELIKMGYSVVVVDDLSSGSMDNISKNVKFYQCDIRDGQSLEKVFENERPEYVIHTAAQISVSKSVREPLYDAQVNIIGIINLLDLSVKYKIRKFVFSSSGGVMYGENPKIYPTPESVCPDPISPYGIAKLASERYLKFYSKEFGLRFTSLRYGNVYGPRQNPDGEAGVIAIFAKKMLKNEPVKINGDGEYIRDYVYVKDVVDANLKSLSAGDGEVLNIGTGTGKSVNDVFRVLRERIGYKLDPIYGPPRSGDLRKSILDNSRAKEILKWEPMYDFERGISETVSYFERGK